MGASAARSSIRRHLGEGAISPHAPEAHIGVLCGAHIRDSAGASAGRRRVEASGAAERVGESRRIGAATERLAPQPPAWKGSRGAAEGRGGSAAGGGSVGRLTGGCRPPLSELPCVPPCKPFWGAAWERARPEARSVATLARAAYLHTHLKRTSGSHAVHTSGTAPEHRRGVGASRRRERLSASASRGASERPQNDEALHPPWAGNTTPTTRGNEMAETTRTAQPMVGCERGLAGLLARWAELAPAEVRMFRPQEVKHFGGEIGCITTNEHGRV